MGEMLKNYDIQIGMEGMQDCIPLFFLSPVIVKQNYNFLKSTGVADVKPQHLAR